MILDRVSGGFACTLLLGARASKKPRSVMESYGGYTFLDVCIKNTEAPMANCGAAAYNSFAVDGVTRLCPRPAVRRAA